MKRLTLILVVIAAAIALGLFASIVSQGFDELAEARAERARLEREKARLRDRIDHLSETLEAVRHDPAAVESLARRELGWVRPGEEVLIIATPVPKAPVSLTEPDPTPILTLRE